MHGTWGLCWEKIVSAKGLGDASAALGNKTAPGKQYLLDIHDLNAVASCHCANLQAGSSGTVSRVVPIAGSPLHSLVASHCSCRYFMSVLASHQSDVMCHICPARRVSMANARQGSARPASPPGIDSPHTSWRYFCCSGYASSLRDISWKHFLLL